MTACLWSETGVGDRLCIAPIYGTTDRLTCRPTGCAVVYINQDFVRSIRAALTTAWNQRQQRQQQHRHTPLPPPAAAAPSHAVNPSKKRFASLISVFHFIRFRGARNDWYKPTTPLMLLLLDRLSWRLGLRFTDQTAKS
jgi:hypothetical protein